MAAIFRLMSWCLLLAALYVEAAGCGADTCGHGFLENAETQWNGTTAKTNFAYTAFMDNRTKRYEETKAGSDWTSGEYVYDGYGQLDEETRDNSTANYAFDTGYNLTTFGSNSLSYSSNQLTAVNTTERQFSYNTQGARTLDDRSGTTNDFEYEYDPFGNLTQVKKGRAVIYTADYDAFGRRFRWSDGTNTSYFLYDGSVPFAEFNASGTLQRRIFWGPTGPICLRQSGNRWFIADKFGNTRALVDDNGSITDYYAYDAWGNVVSAKSSGSTANQFRWNGSSGYQHISQTGLYHVGAREYDPTVGRWLQRDPIAMSGGWPNLYGYCGNDPVECKDPLGTHGGTLDSVTSNPEAWWALDPFASLSQATKTFLEWLAEFLQEYLKAILVGAGTLVTSQNPADGWVYIGGGAWGSPTPKQPSANPGGYTGGQYGSFTVEIPGTADRYSSTEMGVRGGKWWAVVCSYAVAVRWSCGSPGVAQPPLME